MEMCNFHCKFGTNLDFRRRLKLEGEVRKYLGYSSMLITYAGPPQLRNWRLHSPWNEFIRHQNKGPLRK